MTQINLIYHPDDLTAFNVSYLPAVFDKFFNLVEYNSAETYSNTDSLIVRGPPCLNRPVWYADLHQQGIKLLINNLWETPRENTIDNSFLLNSPQWFWYNESLWYKSLEYHQYVPNKTYKKTALMPIRRHTAYRANLVKQLTPHLDNMIYSYNERGVYLPDDMPGDADLFQRYYNPMWYDSTYYSIVAETLISNDTMFVTEKTFKPMAFHHPFLIWGQAGHLSCLQSWGFETFENLFDESYDTAYDNQQRLDKIVENVDNFCLEPYSVTTQEKIDHNHNLFYDQLKVEQGIIDTVINPILEYAETR